MKNLIIILTNLKTVIVDVMFLRHFISIYNAHPHVQKEVLIVLTSNSFCNVFKPVIGSREFIFLTLCLRSLTLICVSPHVTDSRIAS